MLSTICLNLDQSKILSSGNGLKVASSLCCVDIVPELKEHFSACDKHWDQTHRPPSSQYMYFYTLTG